MTTFYDIELLRTIFQGYNIVKVENNKYEDIIITDEINKSNCLRLKFGDDFIEIVTLAKCGNNSGTKLLQLVEQLAYLMPNVTYLKLLDAATLEFQDYKKLNLAFFKILTKGESWYNSLGYYSDNYEEEKNHNQNVIQTPYYILLEKLINDSVEYFKQKNSKEIMQEKIRELEGNNVLRGFYNMYKKNLENYDAYMQNEINNIISKGIKIVQLGNEIANQNIGQTTKNYQIQIVTDNGDDTFKLSMDPSITTQEYFLFLEDNMNKNRNATNILIEIVNFLSQNILKYSTNLKKDVSQIKINTLVGGHKKRQSKTKMKTKKRRTRK